MKKFYQIHSKSFDKYEAKSDQELWEAVKAKGFKGMSVDVKTSFKKAEGETNLFNAVFSSEKEDRHGEIVYQNWDLKSFKQNPVYLDSHNYSSIDFIIGKVLKLKVDDKKRLVGQIQFSKVNPRGIMAEGMASEGLINTSSVGFTPKKFDDKGNILESELLEISAVGVPANPEALYEKGIIVKAEGEVDDSVDVEDTGEPESDAEAKDDVIHIEEEKVEEGAVKEVIEDEGVDEVEEKEEKEEVEEKAVEKPKTITKKTSNELLQEALRSEVDLRIKYLKQISEAISLVREKTKGRNSSQEDRTNINKEINRAVRNLLKMKV